MEAVKSYFGGIARSITSIFEGMAVTMSWLFREPATIQYPYHKSDPSKRLGGPETLPERYRGFLEVDLDICTGCLACVRACPIDCIVIVIEKLEKIQVSDDPEAKPVRMMTRFDIDMAKCMYCGLCSEPCPTHCLRHTTEFESPVANLEHLIMRFIEPGSPAPLFKAKKGEDPPTVPHGSIAQTLYVDRPWDLPPLDLPEIPPPSSEPSDSAEKT